MIGQPKGCPIVIWIFFDIFTLFDKSNIREYDYIGQEICSVCVLRFVVSVFLRKDGAG